VIITDVHYFKFAAVNLVDLKRLHGTGIIKRRMTKCAVDWRGLKKSTENFISETRTCCKSDMNGS
jgi:hypothetical protein